jgi:hypothetical protein
MQPQEQPYSDSYQDKRSQKVSHKNRLLRRLRCSAQDVKDACNGTQQKDEQHPNTGTLMGKELCFHISLG